VYYNTYFGEAWSKEEAELPRNEGSTKTAKYEPISTPSL
jgi:hypothetical protein